MASRRTIGEMLRAARGDRRQTDVIDDYRQRFPLDDRINEQQLSNWERGVGQPSKMRIIQLGEVLPEFHADAALEVWEELKAEERKERERLRREAASPPGEDQAAGKVRKAAPILRRPPGDDPANQEDPRSQGHPDLGQVKRSGRRRRA